MKQPLTRTTLLGQLDGSNWDVIVIGGGITGVGVLRELARRGLKSILLEQRDFAWGTSSRSTKMVHGGLRYLKEGNFSLTRESVLERENLIKELPGLVDNHLFILPFYKHKPLQRLILHLGLIVYDLLSGKWRRHVCGLKEMESRAPAVGRENLQGGFLINDAVTDDARLVLRVLAEAEKQGAQALNYCQVEQLLRKEGAICGVQARDLVGNASMTLTAKLVINATGAWADQLRTQVRKQNKLKIRPLRGSHLILSAKRLPLVDNISIIHPRDKRPVTTLAWEGRILLGTTDIDHTGDLQTEALISRSEVDYLLAALNFQFPGLQLTDQDIISTMAGVRPVIDSGKANPSQESRDHVIWEEDGLLTVTGGKLTTFRIIALDTLKKAQTLLGPLRDLGKKQAIFDVPSDASSIRSEKIPFEKVKRLVGRYGQEVATLIAESSSEALETIPETKTVWAELEWAAQREMVVHLDDLLLRRTRIGLLLKNGGEAYLPAIRQRCQTVLGWNDQQWEEEERRYLAIWQKHYSIPR